MTDTINIFYGLQTADKSIFSITAKNTDALAEHLASGEPVVLVDNYSKDIHATFQFPKTDKGQVFVHDFPATNITQVVDALTGDAHDRSKVQWFDGTNFVSFYKNTTFIRATHDDRF